MTGTFESKEVKSFMMQETRLAKLRASRANSQIAREEVDRVTQEIILNVLPGFL